jgi:GNAT superfamily N-acetyltransferase
LQEYALFNPMPRIDETSREMRGKIVLNDERVAIWRQACRSDLDPLMKMFTALSDESLYMRYIGYHRPTKEEIQAILERQSEEEISIVASPADNEDEIIAQVRCIFMNPPTDAELAVVVHDDWQNQGLGTALVRTILEYVSRARVKRIFGESGISNDRAIHIFHKLGFSTRNRCYASVKMTLTLADTSESRT